MRKYNPLELLVYLVCILLAFWAAIVVIQKISET